MSSVTQFAPGQLAQHLQEDANASNYSTFAYNGALFLFLPDGVGSHASGGGTGQIFIYKSLDNGVTWSDITPAAPVKTEGQFGQTFIRSGNIVYIPTGQSPSWKMLGFDLAAEAWIADGPVSGLITDGLSNSQQVVRANGQIVNLFATGGPQHPWLGVYDPSVPKWVFDPVAIAAVSHAEVLAGVLDSVGHVHFFIVVWTVAVGTGSAKLQHLVVFADNTVSAATDVYSFVNPPDFPGGSGDQVSTPVFYHDVTAAVNKIALLVAVPNASHINTGLLLFTAPESDTPVWAQTTVPTGEDFSAVSLGNAGVSDNSPVASILPVQYPTQTQLQIFWTSNGSFFAMGSNPWNNFFRQIVYSDGVFSAVTTLFSSANTKVTPGPIYPFLISNDGTTAKIGGMFPTIDQALFFSLTTKYQALANWWISFAAVGPISASATSVILAGGMGCTPHCVQSMSPADVETLTRVNRGGDPAILLAVLAALALLESGA